MAIFLEQSLTNRAWQSDREGAREGHGMFAQCVETGASSLHGLFREEGDDRRTDGTTPFRRREDAVTIADRAKDGFRNTGLE